MTIPPLPLSPCSLQYHHGFHAGRKQASDRSIAVACRIRTQSDRRRYSITQKTQLVLVSLGVQISARIVFQFPLLGLDHPTVACHKSRLDHVDAAYVRTCIHTYSHARRQRWSCRASPVVVITLFQPLATLALERASTGFATTVACCCSSCEPACPFHGSGQAKRRGRRHRALATY